jgi:hypothetical protein
MNDKEFQQLRRQIHKKMVELLVLQRLQRNETGQDYVISGPLQADGEDQCAKIDLGRPPLMEYYQYPEGKPRRP